MAENERPGAPARFRKKPVTIEAVQFTDHATVCAFMGGKNGEEHAHWDDAGFGFSPGEEAADGEAPDLYVAGGTIEIETLEGAMVARPGDWIIKGVQGEFYPCKPDIFAASYVPDPPPAPLAPLPVADSGDPEPRAIDLLRQVYWRSPETAEWVDLNDAIAALLRDNGGIHTDGPAAVPVAEQEGRGEHPTWPDGTPILLGQIAEFDGAEVDDPGHNILAGVVKIEVSEITLWWDTEDSLGRYTAEAILPPEAIAPAFPAAAAPSPGVDPAERAVTETDEWAALTDALATADGLTPAEVMSATEHPLAPVADAARALTALAAPASPVPEDPDDA